MSAQAAPRVVELIVGSMAFCGNGERGLIMEAVHASHILDPSSGRPSRDFGRMTVMGPRGAPEWATLHPRSAGIALEVVGAELVAHLASSMDGRVRALVLTSVEVARPCGEPVNTAEVSGRLVKPGPRGDELARAPDPRYVVSELRLEKDGT